MNHASRQVRHRSGGLPMNTVILFVPQQEAWIVERFGKYQRILQPVCIIVLLFHKKCNLNTYSNIF